MMCGSAIARGSKLQTNVAALSIVEAKYMALFASAKDVSFLRHLLATLGEPLACPTLMLEDKEKECESLATNALTPGKTKHVDIRHHFVRDLITA